MEKKVLEILNERKRTAEMKAKENLLLALSFKNFKEHYTKEKTLIIEKAKAQAMGQIFNSYALKTEIDQQILILGKNNLTRQDLVPQYFCKKCGDTGFVCGEECDCVKQIRSDLVLKNFVDNNLKTFADCDYSIFDNNEIVGFYKKMQEWAKTSQRKRFSVVLQGYTGVGKTFLQQCLASEFLKQNKFVVFKTAFEMNNDFLKYHTTFDENKLKYMEKYLTCDALLIDDLGSEPIYKNVTKEYLYLLLNQRIIENKITIVSTNLNLEDIKNIYGERCFSRIINKNQSILYQFKNSDLRLKKA
ncbi:MAG: ATP-binding protein [Clostridia bacterium]|nr:ATP-binding protein [Clostridia bacterium]